MAKAKTFVLLLAVAALSVASPLAQAATTTTLLEVPYGLGPSTNNGGIGRDNSIIGEPNEDHTNHGAITQIRALKAWPHTYLADWDTAPMMADVDVGGQLTGWGAYTPNYYMAIRPVDVGPETDPPGPPLPPDFPDAATPAIVNISSVWSENDWFEGDGATYGQYNWTNPVGNYASTIWYAGDVLVPGMEIPWSFPGGGDDGTGNPYPPFPNCTFVETFHTLGEFGGSFAPWLGVPKTPTNSETFSLSRDNFYLDDNGTPADPNDDSWIGMYAEVQLDQALIDDMFNNADNRGVALWEWDVWENGPIYSADQNDSSWPYIYARIEVCDGDATLDMAVDGLDYVAWSNNYQGAAVWGTGDFNNDAVADGLDYVVWSNNYGTCPAAPGVVPEPASALMLILGICALRRRRQ